MLVNGLGTRGALRVDLCERHNTKAKRLFRTNPPPPTPAGGAGKGNTRHNKRPKRNSNPKRQPIGATGSAKFKDSVIAFAKTPKTRNEIAEHFGINKALTSYHLKKILMAGHLKLIGRGNLTKYVQE